MATFVVCGDGYIDELGGRVRVTESDDRDVDVGSFFDGLRIGTWVGQDDQARFLKGAGDVVGEVPWREATCDSDGTSVGGELENGSLTIGTRRDNADVGWVVDCGDDAGCEDDLLPAVELWLVFKAKD